jgi:hypothetical protein
MTKRWKLRREEICMGTPSVDPDDRLAASSFDGMDVGRDASPGFIVASAN